MIAHVISHTGLAAKRTQTSWDDEFAGRRPVQPSRFRVLLDRVVAAPHISIRRLTVDLTGLAPSATLDLGRG